MMIDFWIAAALLFIIALLFLFWPLLPFGGRRSSFGVTGQKQDNIDIYKDRLKELENEKLQGTIDQSEFDALKAELGQSLLSDVEEIGKGEHIQPRVIGTRQWVLISCLAVLVLISSLFLYAQLGRSDDYLKYLALQEQGSSAVQMAAEIEQVIRRLEERLQQDPEDIANWYLLSNSYTALGRHDKAAPILAKIAALIGPDNADYPAIAGAYAQALFQASGEQMTPEVTAAIERALAADPYETNALMLKGIAAYTQGHFKQAISDWQKAKRRADAAQVKRFIEPAILAAQGRISKTAAAETDASDQPVITIRLDISPDLKQLVSNEQTVFVFARPEGAGMPLAAEKLQVKDLPATIRLDDTKAVMPSAKLSSAETVNITARISFSGQARAQPGDLYATLQGVEVATNERPLTMLISKQVE